MGQMVVCVTNANPCSARVLKVVELGCDTALPCPVGDGAEMADGTGVLDGYDLSRLPVTPVDDRLDLLAEVMFVGKAVMKAMYVS